MRFALTATLAALSVGDVPVSNGAVVSAGGLAPPLPAVEKLNAVGEEPRVIVAGDVFEGALGSTMT